MYFFKLYYTQLIFFNISHLRRDVWTAGTDERFSMFCIHIVGSLLPLDRNKYWLAYIDRFTCRNVALENVTAVTVVHNDQNISFFYILYRVITDKLSQLSAELFHNLSVICCSKISAPIIYLLLCSRKLKKYINRNLKQQLECTIRLNGRRNQQQYY